MFEKSWSKLVIFDNSNILLLECPFPWPQHRVDRGRGAQLGDLHFFPRVALWQVLSEKSTEAHRLLARQQIATIRRRHDAARHRRRASAMTSLRTRSLDDGLRG